MKIGVDIDGVLANLMPDLTAFYNLQNGTNINHRQQNTYYLDLFWQCSREKVFQTIDEFYAQPEFSRIKPVRGAKGAIKSLAKNHELFVITSRTENILPQTTDWIDKHFSKAIKGIYFTGSAQLNPNLKKGKSDYCRDLEVEVMIEDSLEYATECASCGIKVLLFNTTWNQTDELPEKIKRVKSWKEITQILNG